MTSMSVPIGKGLKFPGVSSVFISRVVATVVGGIYMLAEDETDDSAAVTVENSGADNGTLANTVGMSAAGVAGITNAAGTEACVAILATEAVAIGAMYIGLIEGYFVDVLVITAGANTVRSGLFLTATANAGLDAARTGLGQFAHGRLLRDVAGAQASPGVMSKVHFCGYPGGFGNGPGAT